MRKLLLSAILFVTAMMLSGCIFYPWLWYDDGYRGHYYHDGYRGGGYYGHHGGGRRY